MNIYVNYHESIQVQIQLSELFAWSLAVQIIEVALYSFYIVSSVTKTTIKLFIKLTNYRWNSVFRRTIISESIITLHVSLCNNDPTEYLFTQIVLLGP